MLPSCPLSDFRIQLGDCIKYRIIQKYVFMSRFAEYLILHEVPHFMEYRFPRTGK